MNDNDCVSRSWLLAEYDRQHEGPAGKARKLIEDAPAVPQEMSAVEYIREYRRMCDFYFGKPATDGGVPGCGDCPGRLNGKKNCIFSPTRDESSIPIIERWVREHPEEVKDEQ